MPFAQRLAPRVKKLLTVSFAVTGVTVAAYAAPQVSSAGASGTIVKSGIAPAKQAKPIPPVITSAAGSKIVARTMHSEALDRDWPYVLYLPPGYTANGERYPVLYLLHGNNGDAYDWITQGRLQSIVDGLIARREIPPLLIVMPQGGTDWYVDRKEPIETAFFEELLPEIETQYAVETQREGRVIGGVSMGGFGALRYAMSRPQLFCGALLLGPAIYSGDPPVGSAARYVHVFGERQFDPRIWRSLNYPAQWQGFIGGGYRVPMFIAAGDDDLRIQAEASQLYTHLREAHQPAELRIIDGGHTWAVWSAVLAEALKYTLACTR